MNNIVESNRIIYTPGDFAKKSLIYLQEIGQSKSIKKHISSKDKLDSFLFMIVLEGDGIFNYKNRNYHLKKDDCVFVDCNEDYFHSSDNWTISWIHFYGNNSKDIYKKYLSRDGKNIFTSVHLDEYKKILSEIREISSSNDYIKDTSINLEITRLLSVLMSETIYETSSSKRIYNIREIKAYIDENYEQNIFLDELSSKFFINKFYLTRLFKDTYNQTINSYINFKRITKAKQLLRFSDMDIEEISKNTGIIDTNYFCRLFKKIEGITPKQYQKMWH